MIKRGRKILFVLVAGLTSLSSQAYELATHARITYSAYQRSVLGNQKEAADLYNALGINSGTAPFGSIYVDVSGIEVNTRQVYSFEASFMPLRQEETLSLPAWLLRGAIREDDNITPIAPKARNAATASIYSRRTPS